MPAALAFAATTACNARAGRAIIIGGSMAGLISGLLLHRQGWDVQLHERSAHPLSGRGAGIVTHPELVAVLAAAGLDPIPDLGVAVASRITLDPHGAEIGRMDCAQVLTSWDHLFALLRAQFPPGRYHLGHDLRQMRQDGRRVIAEFADGSTDEADLLVGADGIRSAVRGQFLPDIQPVYAGYTAWRGLVAEADLSPATHAALFPYFAFCLPPGEQILGYPVAGPGNDLRPGHRRYNFVWYRPADEATMLPELLTDTAGRVHAQSIPPPLIRPERIVAMRAASGRTLAPAFADIIAATRQPFLQPIYDLEAPQLVFGRVALVGDAAFVARPHIGAGVSKAAEDAFALAETLSETADIDAALARFAQRRAPQGHRIVQRARHLGAYLQAQLHTQEERAAAARHHAPDAVMAETALLDFLREG